MGLVVWQQLEGGQFDTPVVKLQVHHASAFGSHACTCQFCNASWDL
ncbi:unnamed protein product [Staurois parvus]|uniref:Uncharacterized protein n=1 Tax=Staurois parvus TaxID=386267 RepID=A0ABN9ENA7_9NEOB|nr:unnamed protein product [Staurois parvus]